MRVALVHDYIKEYGGAERVLEALHEIYPEAPVFTTVYLPEYLGPHKSRFKDWDIRTSFLQNFPFKQKLISPFRLLSTFAFKGFDFSEFDVVIVSATGAYFPNSIKTKRSPSPIRLSSSSKTYPLPSRERDQVKRPFHICYCHTPPRYLYGYATAREWKKNILLRILGETANHFLRMVDFNASKNVDQYIANSEEVARRIKKFYRREAVVVYPPVDIKQVQSSKLKVKSYYVAGGRLARAKHVDLIVRVCTEQNLPLKIFGKAFAGYGEELQKLAGSTISFLGEVTDEEKWRLLSEAKAYIFAGEDEDFGILPVEAMAAGTPVIAYRSGGVQETVVDPSADSGQATGLFFDELTTESLAAVIQTFEKRKFDPAVCRKRAEVFSKERFLKKTADLVTQKVKNI